MRQLAAAIAALCLCLAPSAASAQAAQSFEIQAKRPLPKGKYAVALEVDSELGRDLRRAVMDRLAARGNEVGFSGGHVMRLRVDVSRGFRSGPGAPPPAAGGAGLPPIPDRPASDLRTRPDSAAETLRLTLTMAEAGTGEVLWVAYASCAFGGGRALDAGRSMIGAIFASPDRSRRGEADCPP